MNAKDTHAKLTAHRRGQSVPSPADSRVTVIGLGGIGRQVALLLAALGVQRLQLLDHRNVARHRHVAEGYAQDDIGRPRVHAAAYQCHQLNPKLEIEAMPKQPTKGIDLGGAVFLCPGWEGMGRALKRMMGTMDGFVAQCSVVDTTIHIEVACDAQSAAALLGGPKPESSSSKRRRRIAAPLYVATIAAGLLVSEFARMTMGQGVVRSIRLDLRSMDLEVTPPP